jgi:hypothetical protein
MGRHSATFDPTTRHLLRAYAGSDPRRAVQVAQCHYDHMSRPAITDFGGIVDAARRDGSVHFPVESVPGEFVAWRRRVRQRARGDGLSISVIRAGGLVVVENREWEPSEAEGSAVADVIQGVLTGDRVTYDDALHRRRRERLRLT